MSGPGKPSAASERARLLAAIQERLERLRVTGDPASVLGPDAGAEAQELLELVGDLARDREAAQALGWLSWRRYQLSPEEEWVDLLIAANCLLVPAGVLPEGPYELLCRHLLEGIDLFDDYQRTGDLDTLREAIRLFRQALSAALADDMIREDFPVRRVIAKDLSRALRSLFGRTGDLATVDEAIQLARDALAASWPSHPERAVRLTDLALALQARFRRARDRVSLDEATKLFQKALDATPPDDPDRAERLSNLALAKEDGFELDGAIDLFRQGRGCDAGRSPRPRGAPV
jgi:tetratricopeptide (TPR) repeat protein